MPMGKQRAVLADTMALAYVAAGIAALYRTRLQPWMYTWGAGAEEIEAALPGDGLVAVGTPRTTRAITIDAPRHTVWSWLVQIGEGRGGFYSYDILERAVGARIFNADTLHPEWADLRVGDTIWLARRYGDRARQVVALVEPDSHLMLVSPEDFDHIQRGEPVSATWSFHVRRTDGWTRLLARGSGGLVGHAWFDIVHFVMERRMLCGIRDRAERTSRENFEKLVFIKGEHAWARAKASLSS